MATLASINVSVGATTEGYSAGMSKAAKATQAFRASVEGHSTALQIAGQHHESMRHSLGLLSEGIGTDAGHLREMAHLLTGMPPALGIAAAAVLALKLAWDQEAEATKKANEELAKAASQADRAIQSAMSHDYPDTLKEELDKRKAELDAFKAELEKNRVATGGALHQALFGGGNADGYGNQEKLKELEMGVDRAAKTYQAYTQMQSALEANSPHAARGILGDQFSERSGVERLQEEFEQHRKNKDILGETLYLIEQTGVLDSHYREVQKQYDREWQQAAQLKNRILDEQRKKQEEAAREAQKFQDAATKSALAAQHAMEEMAHQMEEAAKTPLEKLTEKIAHLWDIFTSTPSMSKSIFDSAAMQAVKASGLGNVKSSAPVTMGGTLDPYMSLDAYRTHASTEQATEATAQKQESILEQILAKIGTSVPVAG